MGSDLSIASRVPVIGRAELLPLFDLLSEQKAPIGELLARSGLPGCLQEPSDGFVPARFLLGWNNVLNTRGGTLATADADGLDAVTLRGQLTF